MNLPSDQIQRLAPDVQVLAAGRKLGSPARWQDAGRRDGTVWGECRGSALYQVGIETGAMAYTCSCPSRKRPCKHVVGLLTLSIEHEPALVEAAPGTLVRTAISIGFAAEGARRGARRLPLGEKVRRL